MHHLDWKKVRNEIGTAPIVEGLIEGPVTLYVERYLFQSVECSVSGGALPVLCTQFGGNAINEGNFEQAMHRYLPTQSGLIPPGVETHWHYSSTVDFALFYILGGTEPLLQHLSGFLRKHTAQLTFSDALVGTLAHGIVDELQKGAGADEPFLGRMAHLLVERTFRALTTPDTGVINPRHAHYARLQAALNHIHGNLQEVLSLETLAALSGVSTAYFREIFQEAIGTTPHRYVLAQRIERARKLLTQSSWPISRIAQCCGFSSQSHLTATFRAVHGTTPGRFRAATTRKPDNAGSRGKL